MKKNANFQVEALTYEVKLKLFAKSCLKILIDSSTFSNTTELQEAYLNAPDFPLKPLSGKYIIKKPLTLKDLSLYIGEADDQVPNGLGYKLDPDGNYYEGHFLDGKFSGQGRLFSLSGQIITGEWLENDINNGTILNYFGKSYEGEIRELMPWGTGEETSEDYIYKGEFSKGKKNGFGKIEWNDNSWYEGDFIMGRIEGQGKFSWSDSLYEGECKANKMHGFGVQIWDNGNKYEGKYVAGLQEGYGVMTTKNSKYSGYWKHGLYEGKGVLEADGKVVEGIWTAGSILSSAAIESDPEEPKSSNSSVRVKFHHIEIPEKLKTKCQEILSKRDRLKPFKDSRLNTTERWKKLKTGAYFGENESNGRGLWLKSSQIYEGSFLDGERHGFGRLINLHDEVYVGDFFNGVRSGFGVLKKPNADYIGEWQDNKFHGRGVLITPELVYDGDWVQGLQNGKGTLEYPDEKIYSGEFKNGKIEGLGDLKLPNGNIIKALWLNGEISKILEKVKFKSEVTSEDILTEEDKQNLFSFLSD